MPAPWGSISCGTTSRIHQTLKMTPAMKTVKEILALTEKSN